VRHWAAHIEPAEGVTLLDRGGERLDRVVRRDLEAALPSNGADTIERRAYASYLVSTPLTSGALYGLHTAQ